MNKPSSTAESKPTVVSAQELYDPQVYQRLIEYFMQGLPAPTTYTAYGGAYAPATAGLERAGGRARNLTMLPTFGPAQGYLNKLGELLSGAQSWMGQPAEKEISDILSSARKSAESAYGELQATNKARGMAQGYTSSSALPLEGSLAASRLSGGLAELEAGIRYQDLTQRRELEQGRLQLISQGLQRQAELATRRGEAELARNIEASRQFIEVATELSRMDERAIDRQIQEYGRVQGLNAEEIQSLREFTLGWLKVIGALLRGEVATTSTSQQKSGGILYNLLTNLGIGVDLNELLYGGEELPPPGA